MPTGHRKVQPKGWASFGFQFPPPYMLAAFVQDQVIQGSLIIIVHSGIDGDILGDPPCKGWATAVIVFR